MHCSGTRWCSGIDEADVEAVTAAFGARTALYARFTTRLNRALERVGLALAGWIGARLAAQLGFGAGRMTLLRRHGSAGADFESKELPARQ